MNTPSLSILMPVYNGERYLRESISSILNQSFHDFELIIVNDGSQDGTAGLVSRYTDPRIRFIDRKENLGVVHSRNEALDAARGDFLAFFDADDIAHPEKFSIQMDFMRKNPEVGVLGTTALRIGPRGEVLGKWKLRGQSDHIRARMLFHNAFVNSSVIFRNDVLSALRFTEGMAPCEDYLFWWKMIQGTKAHILRRSLTLYRVHQDSLTGANPGTLARCDREVTRIILEDAGIRLSEDLLCLHLELKSGRSLKRKADLKALRNWLLQMETQQQVVPHRIMRNTLVNRWIKVIWLCRRYPLLMLRALADLRLWIVVTKHGLRA
ncbi:MAG: glycosyltransferase [Bacteroidales bacterium]|nr:glycosyltransferase [Bacteroidales bacterium]